MPPRLAILLMDKDGRVVYASAEAAAILSYPAPPADPAELTRIVFRKVLALDFPTERARHAGFSVTFRSGDQTYVCRGCNAEPAAGQPPLLALVIEPASAEANDLSEFVRRYSLTSRETEILHFLVLGLTNKEIANHMQVSPHTVKAHLKFVMAKMGVTTRSAIVGRLLGGAQRRSPHAATLERSLSGAAGI